MSKKIIDLGFGTPNDNSLGFLGDPSTGALSKATYLTLKNYFQSGSNLSLTGSFVTTGSFNAFSSSYHSDSGSFYTNIKNIQTSQSGYVLTSSYLPFSSSYSVDSSSFDSRIKAISGSLLTGSFVTTLTFNVFSGSVASSFSASNAQILNVFSSQSNYLPTSSFNSLSSSYSTDSSSFNLRIANSFISESNYVLTSSYLPFSASYVTDSGSLSLRISNVFASESNYLSTSSVQGNNNYLAVFSSSQGFTFGSAYQSGSSLIIGGVTGILPGVGLQVNGPIYQNDNTYTKIATGNTVQRPSGSLVTFGMFRGNTDTTNLEYYNGISWLSLGSGSGVAFSGSVTSVGLSLPSLFNVSNSPIVGAGTLSGSFNSFSAGLFLATPSSSAGVPSMRAITISDISPLTSSFIGNFVLTSSFNVYTASANSQSLNIFASQSNYTPTSSFTPFSASYVVDSSSFNVRINSHSLLITNVFASESNYLPTSSFSAFSSSFVGTSASISTQITNTFASESNYLPTSSIVGANKFIPLFTGVFTLSSSIMYQSGSGTGSAILINGNTTGSNNAALQVSGGLSVTGPIFDSTNSTGSLSQVLSSTPGGILWTSTGSGFWSLSGNTIVSGSFLGTVNAQDLIFKRNNVQMGVFTSNNSIVLGNSNNGVTGSNAITLGGSNNSSNTMAATLAGGNNIASGNSSVVIGGQNNNTIGIGSVILGGTNLSASAYSSVVIGRFNDPIVASNTTSWVGTDPLFIAGNGSSTSSLSNALVLLKNGTLQLPFYNTSTSSFLVTDQNGNVASFPVVGNNGFIPLFSGSNGFTSSLMFQSSSVIFISASIVQSGGPGGFSSKAGGLRSTALGANCNASGQDSIAYGEGNTSAGQGSHAEGGLTYAGGLGSHAEGGSTSASAQYAHSEGVITLASGQGSHAEGSASISLGAFSHASGLGTIASGSGQNVMGYFNNSGNTSSLVVIGNGTTSASRSDLVLFNPNNIQFYQDVFVSSSLHISQSIYDSTGAVGSVGQLLSSTVTGVQWITTSGSAIFSGFVTTGSFNLFSSSYSNDSSSFNSRINAINSSILSLTGSYVTTNIFNPYTASVATQSANIFASQSNYVPLTVYNPFTGSVNTQITNVFASESNYVPTSSLKGLANYQAIFTGTSTLSSSMMYQSGSGTGSATLVGGNTTGSNGAILQIFGNIYISKSIYDSTNSTGSTNNILVQSGTGIQWVASGSVGSTVNTINFIVGDGQSFTPSASTAQFSSSLLIGKTVLQFFEEGTLLSPVSRSVAWYSSTGSSGTINLGNATFDFDTFYSILYK